MTFALYILLLIALAPLVLLGAAIADAATFLFDLVFA